MTQADFVFTSYPGAPFLFTWWDLFVFVLFNAPHSTHLTHKRLGKLHLFSLTYYCSLLHNTFWEPQPTPPSSTILLLSLQDKPSWKLLSPQLSPTISSLALCSPRFFKVITFYFGLLLVNPQFFKQKLMLKVVCVPVIVLINASRRVYLHEISQ